ncbi:MAG: AAA family ATPase, partial [Patescibacteria group bacterium]
MARIISLVNQKGGVGKTTTAVNLGAYLARMGRFVLLVDIDPQGNASSGMGIEAKRVQQGVYEAIINKASFRDITHHTQFEGYKVAPSTMSLAGANVELVPVEQREYRLHNSLMEVKHDFDYIIIDCPPSLGLLTINGLVAADEILIPVQSEYYALEGLGQLLNTVNLIKENLKPELSILGAVLTMFDRRYQLSQEVMQELYKFFPNKIFRSVIPRNIRLAEAPSFGESILTYDPKSKGAKAYERLAREIIDTEN